MGIVSAPSELTLDNCENELIHIPGQVQGHGALLAFLPDGVLGWASANAGLVTAVKLPEIGQALHSQHFDGQSAVHDAVAYELAEPPGATSLPRLYAVVLAGVAFDLIVHRCDKAVLAELKRHIPAVSRPAAFAVRAHRVMAYRFGHDGSGEVVAESRRNDLKPFLNLRYPASDIPPQARRLYVVDTLRLTADVRSTPVPLRADGTETQTLDMRHCVLRSVSPVHIDYLTTMGVRASMSMSIVIDGRLCGLLACHHMTPRQVPFAVRRAGACCKGLGLYIAHEIARGHGGTLAYNYVAPDVVFTFGFPTHPSDALHGDLPVVSSASAPLPRMVPKSAPAPAN